MRYLGQGFEVEIPFLLNDTIGALSERFHNAHKNEYGFNNMESLIECVEIRAIWEISAKNFKFQILNRLKHSEKITALWERDKKNKNMIKRKCKIMLRESMKIGSKIIGPAILTESDTTVYIPTGWVANFVEGGYLKISFLQTNKDD